MPTQSIQIKTLYTFDELDDSAKETARQWYREGAFDWEWWDFEDSKACGKILGIDIDKIYFSGFASQGDGACFEGSYSYAKGAVKAIKAYAPTDKTLHQIAEDLQSIQRRYFYQLSASVKHSGHYYHENCTEISVSDDRDGYGWDAGIEAEDAITEALRDFMRWIYRQLESEYEYINSDEAVDESILINEYTFDEEGNRDG